MKPSHYETLGVKPDAKPDEIKRAFRRKAEKLHPDKGGDHLEMAAVNRAYHALSDPQRRAAYDHTGTDHACSLEDRARGAIAQAFSDALQKNVPDALAHARKSIEATRSNSQQKISEIENSLRLFRKRRNKIKTSEEINLFHSLIDQQIAIGEQSISGFKGNLEICDAALKILESYTTTEKIPQAQPASYVIFDFTASTTGTSSS